MQQIFKSVVIALQNIKANPLHTFLSTLGIVIGVAALVAILALGDGLEETGRQQIESTTSLQFITVSPNQYRVKNSIRVPLDTVHQFTLNDHENIKRIVGDRGIVDISSKKGEIVAFEDSLRGITLYGNTKEAGDFLEDKLIGRYHKGNGEEVFISGALALEWADTKQEMLNKKISIKGDEYTVVGVSEDGREQLVAAVPITQFNSISKEKRYPDIIVKAVNIEDVSTIKSDIEHWLSENYANSDRYFGVSTNQMRVEQFGKGILLFKLIMGAITGISVLVGGIGIMNVLLISVTERTKEIGIRKATGAQKKDIILQFMSESVTISMVGCIVGWIVGIASVFIFVPIVNSIVDVGFNAAVSMGSAIVILIIAICVGIIFGTYPAWRAAQLTPVDAIRHE
ncbi:MAG: ABC transporter permease [Balneolaceae bacterium]|nr:ABC transporter permease [Balneolaceae bacterium]